MNILIVGGTGLIGGHAALRLARNGHAVTIAGRRPAKPKTPMAALDFMPMDYIANDVPRSTLARFEAMIFCAGQDPRMLPSGEDVRRYMARANEDAVPGFFSAARDAGIRTAVNIGTFYPQAAPHLIVDSPYMMSRKISDERVCALASARFRSMSINPPWVPGAIRGLETVLWEPYLRYAAGLTDLPIFAPPGGCAFISLESLSDAIEGALARGKAGASYLVNGENLSFQAFLGEMFLGFGRRVPPIEDRDHPVISDRAISWGRGNDLFYEPDAQETALLGYRRGDVLRTIREDMVPEFRRRTGT